MHFIYRGSCKYNLLCRTYELKTTGQKLLDHKLYKMELTRPVSIVLTRIEDCADNIENTEQPTYDSDNTELYYPLETPTSIDQTMIESESTEIYELTTNYALKTYQDKIKKLNLNGNCYKKKEKSIVEKKQTRV